MDILATANLAGVAVFAASGALLAAERRFDLVGAIFLSAAVGLGGGTLVDLLIGREGVRWMTDPAPFIVAVASGAIVFAAASKLHQRLKLLNWADAAGLALFTASSLQYALQAQVSMVAAGILGILGACGGGIIRDTLANRDPLVFSGELYVTASFAGVIAYLATNTLAQNGTAAYLLCVLVTFGLRAGALTRGWRLSRA